MVLAFCVSQTGCQLHSFYGALWETKTDLLFRPRDLRHRGRKDVTPSVLKGWGRGRNISENQFSNWLPLKTKQEYWSYTTTFSPLFQYVFIQEPCLFHENKNRWVCAMFWKLWKLKNLGNSFTSRLCDTDNSISSTENNMKAPVSS
jgi:hypothetical protein